MSENVTLLSNLNDTRIFEKIVIAFKKYKLNFSLEVHCLRITKFSKLKEY